MKNKRKKEHRVGIEREMLQKEIERESGFLLDSSNTHAHKTGIFLLWDFSSYPNDN